MCTALFSFIQEKLLQRVCGCTVFASVAPNSIHFIDNVEINEGQGLLGLLLKGELRQILEGDIAQARLFYYSDQTSINSIAASVDDAPWRDEWCHCYRQFRAERVY